MRWKTILYKEGFLLYNIFIYIERKRQRGKLQHLDSSVWLLLDYCCFGGMSRVAKRQRGLVRCSSSSESTPETGIQSWFPPQSSSDLSDFTVDDYMLVEVLSRLPSIRSLVQCMCVCKAWYRIISSYYFVRRFISHRINNTLDDHAATDDDVLVNYQSNPFNMIFAYTVIDRFAEPLPFQHHYKFLLSNQYLPLFQTLGYDFSFLPVEKNKRQGGFEIWAAYNDLILCSVGPRDCSLQRYLCNPFTKQWVALPPNAAGVRAGLVCEPYCLEDTRGMYTLNYHYRYRVVSLTDPRLVKDPWIDIYSSETGKWVRLPTLPDGLDRARRCCTNVVTHNRKLHWYNGRDIVAFDPFDTQNTLFIQGSPDMCHTPVPGGISPEHCLGLCRGFLRFMKMHSPRLSASTLMVWDLKDQVSGNWSLVHHLNLNSVMEISDSDSNFHPYGLTCHPTDPDIIYFLDFIDVISLNLQTGDWEVVDQTSGAPPSLLSLRALPVVLPLWPTPIPPCPSSAMLSS